MEQSQPFQAPLASALRPPWAVHRGFPSWIPPKVPGTGQKGGSPSGIRGQPTLLTLPGIWSWDPKEGRCMEVGLTAASQKRELHEIGTQQVATIIVIIWY